MESLTIDMVQYDCPYIDTSEAYDVSFYGAHWDFDTSRRQLEARVVVQGADREAVTNGLAALDDHPNMPGHTLLSRRGDRALVRSRAEETDAMRAIRGQGGYLTGPFEAAGGSELWHVGFDDGHRAEAALAELGRHNDFTVESRETVDFEDFLDVVRNAGAAKSLLDGCRDLSGVERATLRTAFDSGYFLTPREATLGTLADAFDVSKTAASKNLRRAERKLAAHVVSVLDDLE